MKLTADEPGAGSWRVRQLSDVARHLVDQAGDVYGRPVVIGVDGRSASGKSTLSDRLRRVFGSACVVHTDDIAWYHGLFNWEELISDGVLGPVHRGEDVQYRPPAWDARGRTGAIEVDRSCAVLVVEGVGVARRALMKYLDAVVWVQSDLAQARVRGLARDGDSPAEVAFWDEWDAAELIFLAHERRWERADLIVAGTPVLRHDPVRQVVAATGLRR